MTTLIEIVQTGEHFTAFLLAPHSTRPKKITSGVNEELLTDIATQSYPEATVVTSTEFADEVRSRMMNTVGRY